ncbi:LysR family transcriptional regulator [Bradyrhizobium japonicum]
MTAAVLDPDLLMAFAAVAEHRSFTRAAVSLNRTQSAVSVQIRRLEERIGTKLFQRTRAGVALTAAGEDSSFMRGGCSTSMQRRSVCSAHASATPWSASA